MVSAQGISEELKIKVFKKIKTRGLCSVLLKEFERRGFCIWPVKNRKSVFKLGITLPDYIAKYPKKVPESVEAIEKLAEKIAEPYKARVIATNPVFSVGGGYASYMAIEYNKRH